VAVASNSGDGLMVVDPFKAICEFFNALKHSQP
jgi:hypothetical protein